METRQADGHAENFQPLLPPSWCLPCSWCLCLPAGEAEAAAARAAELEAELAQQKELVGHLEEDLLAAEGAAGGGATGSAGGPDSAAAEGGEGGEQTMVAVLCSQRDRYRARVQEVEGHLATLGQELKKVSGVGCPVPSVQPLTLPALPACLAASSWPCALAGSCSGGSRPCGSVPGLPGLVRYCPPVLCMI